MKKFSLGIVLRISFIVGWSFVITWAFFQKNYSLLIFSFLIESLAVLNLYTYVTSLNRKMKRLFESIQYQDFAITFKADNQMGKSFEDLNSDLNAILFI